jgi:hypothetical protein
VQILDGGFAGSSCASASGYGCWLVGAERATGSYRAHAHRLTLQWFSGQSFTADSAGTEVHLSGTFVGAPHALAKGTTVDLGTASFDAGSTRVVDASLSHRRHASHQARRRRAHERALLAAGAGSTTTGSPRAFLLAEVLVLLNIVAFCAFARRRSHR